jgi:hypothetical protein
MNSPKVGPRGLAGLVIVLTFIVGGLAGAVTDRTIGWPRGRHDRPPAHGGSAGPAPDRPEDRAVRRERFRQQFVQQMQKDLGLNPSQVARFDTITRRQNERMDSLRKAMWPRFDTIIQQTRREIDQILTPEQRQKVREQFEHREGRKQGGAKASGPGTDTTSGKR